MLSLQGLVGRLGASFTELNTDFGELCDGVIDNVLDEYDEAVEGVRGASGVLSKKRVELKRSMLRDLGVRYMDVVSARSCEEEARSFRVIGCQLFLCVWCFGYCFHSNETPLFSRSVRSCRGSVSSA